MTLVNRLAKYYKYCLYEEAKISAFSNLHKEDNIVVKLNGYEKIFHNYPTPQVVQEESAALTQIMLKQQVDKKKQLIYGYIFITGTLEDGTEIYTPLIYADCSLERINGKLSISVNTDTVSFNLPVLVQLASTTEDKDLIIHEFLKYDSVDVLPFTEETIKVIENTMGDLLPNLDIKGKLKDLSGNEYKVHLNREHAVILTTINKGLSGVIQDLNTISQTPESIINMSSLKAVLRESKGEDLIDALDEVYPSQFPYVDNDCTLDRFLPAFELDNSQKDVAQVASTDTITAITGGPGTGKSNTIAAIATNYMLNGKTVLICSKMNSAVDVVYNKLQSLSEVPYVVRTGGNEYRKSLSELLDKITMNRFNLTPSNILTKANCLDLINLECDSAKNYQEAHELYLEASEKSDEAYNDWKEETNTIKKFFKKRKSDKLSEEANDLFIASLRASDAIPEKNELLSSRKKAIPLIAKGNLAQVLQDNILRRKLTLFSKSIKKNGLSAFLDYTIFPELVNVIPCWCTTTVDVSSSIPPIAGLFDVVIIDEASQCDIATCFPLLYRAKRAVIVGDDKQLKYLSFLSNAVNNANIENNDIGNYKYICNYRENSMFDFANYFSNGNVMLKTQYRGCPEIMNFSNEKFYDNNIKNVGKSYYSHPVLIQNVHGTVLSNKSVNNIEAKVIIESIKDIIDTDKNEGKSEPTTIGVLSPFREQCKLLEKMITYVFTTDEIEKHKIIVGTAHSFQGEERDVMLISWTVADNSPVQSFTFINNPNLFNVSITRARYQIINYISTSNLPKGLLKEYVEYCENVNTHEVEQIPAEVA